MRNCSWRKQRNKKNNNDNINCRTIPYITSLNIHCLFELIKDTNADISSLLANDRKWKRNLSITREYVEYAECNMKNFELVACGITNFEFTLHAARMCVYLVVVKHQQDVSLKLLICIQIAHTSSQKQVNGKMTQY